MNRLKVLVTDHVFPDLAPEHDELDGMADIVQAPAGSAIGDLLSVARDADAVLNCYLRLTPEFVNHLERCRIIARYGIGVDTIPLAAASARGIHVTNVPDYCIDEVADHALALALALVRGIDRGVAQTRHGGWDIKALMPMRRLRGQTAALIGFGRIARSLAQRLSVLGYEVLAFDPHQDAAAMAAAGGRKVELDEAFARADLLSLHAPLSEQTKHLVNAQRLATMKPGAVLINTSRGGLVDFDALCAALEAGRLGGAGLDVLEAEPPPPNVRLSSVPRLVVTPHLGFYSEEALRDLQRGAAREVARVLRGELPINRVNRIG